MERQELLQRQNQMLSYLSSLPRKIVQVHGHDSVAEFVLHSLCDEHCFNLAKAAYFVDNPDFDCMKGVAGFSRDEMADDAHTLWDDPVRFQDVAQNSLFNQKVRSHERVSLKRNDHAYEKVGHEIAQELGLQAPVLCSWEMKHGNHGLLIAQRVDETEPLVGDYLINGASLLSFCPIR